FIFTLIYTLIGLFTGSLADRVSRPRLIAAGLFLWSALTAATGQARSFLHMAAARLFVGVGEACLTPAALSMLADRFPPAHRSMASGVYYLGIPVGIGGSFIFAGIVGPTLGWRGGFMLLGFVGIAAALLVLLLMRDPPRGTLDPGLDTSHPRVGSFGESFRGIAEQLRTNPAFTLTLLGCIAVTFVQGTTVLDLVWWVKERGYSEAEAQKLFGLVFLVGGILGAVIGGIGGDWAHARFSAGRLKFLAWVFLATIPMLIGYRLVPGHTLAFYGLALSGAIIFMLVFGPAVSTLQELVPLQHRASAVAVFILCTSFLGSATGNAVVGYLADIYTAAGGAEPITRAILVSQIGGLLAIPAFFLAARYQSRRSAAGARPG
ncbi:MAG: MFS transporter, partial [Nevskiales bacterium]